MSGALSWAPALVLAGGVALVGGVSEQRAMPLERSLAEAVPAVLAGRSAQDYEIPEAEREVAGMSSYLMRLYGPGAEAGEADFTLYVGYYESQMQGRTIHSPKNCLPGSGWEALASRQAVVPTPAGPVTVNRYVIQRGHEKALVLYWYQGRGRVAANEYRVKLDLLRDAALHRRSEEALVRILVPFAGDEAAAHRLATSIAAEVVPALDAALPRI
ncbi:MAG TPA: EpsI family protein [Methylomirabilota bacterium]